MGWLVALDDYPRGMFIASDSTGNLGQQLEDAFAGLVVGQRKATIGLNDANETKARQVEAFGDNLRADDDVDVAVIQCLVVFFDT